MAEKIMDVILFTCGEGLGHTGRSITLGRELMSAGHTVHFGAYGYSKELIEKSGYTVCEIPQELKLVGKEGSLNLEASIRHTIKSMSLRNILSVFRLVREKDPDIIVSDGYYLGILAARLKKIGTCMIVNQSNMEEFFQSKGSAVGVLGIFVRRFYHFIYHTVDRIVVPDFPEPYTVCARNLAFPQDIRKKMTFSGPLVRKRFSEVEAPDMASPHVLCTIGGFGYRREIFDKILVAAKMDHRINYTLIAGPSLDIGELGEIPENVNICSFIADPFPYYKASDLVISAGGHGTLMETLSFGLPLFSFPDQGHNEQENNAQVVDNRGYGRRLDYSVSAQELLSMICEVVFEGKFGENTAELRKQAESLYGPASVRKLLESICTETSKKCNLEVTPTFPSDRL
ncbi:glycosyltransferase [Methanolobus sp. ZRKC2]|uniref:UDP-N-acetylglucosamine--N-acetylmuramyl- (pentapeptide) pyrophosphoryl-undecaprenol N-acetylglucosamine transferase n=1 Tax=Methanolobus sp. ZRKC2 TaxID=3125783 RepID=UPI00325474B3